MVVVVTEKNGGSSGRFNDKSLVMVANKSGNW